MRVRVPMMAWGVTILIGGLWLASCASDGKRVNDDDDDDSGGGAPGGAGGQGQGGNGGTTSSPCVSTIPCSNDTQCVTLPGYGCNTGLVPPMCQQLYCGGTGTACDTDRFCQTNIPCRVLESGATGICRDDPPSQDECLAACLSCEGTCYFLSDPQQQVCPIICSDMGHYCSGPEGFGFVDHITSCEMYDSGYQTVDVNLRCGDGTSNTWTVSL